MVYRNPQAPTALRVADLLGRMTLEEKVAQLGSIWWTKDRILDVKTGAFSPEKASVVMKHGLGHVGRPSDTAGLPGFADNAFREPEDAITFINAVQKFVVEKTRLGIPVLFHEETAHGLAVKGATSFPTPTALGSTWDPDLIERIFTCVARQTRGRGISVGFSPVLDLIRDPRWGRNEEFLGEDPYLVGEIGTAAVWGLQGRSRPIAEDRVFATLKHFVHGTPLNGLNSGPSDMSERELYEYFLPPFRKVIKEGHPAVIMASYNEVGGVPSHANKKLLQDIGRKQFGFDGAYFSDYGGVEELSELHHMGANIDDAAVLGMNAGIDANLPDGNAYAGLAALVTSGRIPIASVDMAVSRILSLKFEAGLFEHPYVDRRKAAAALKNPEAPGLSRLAAQKSIVLLKNDGILPIDPTKALKLAVIGPNSVRAMLGGYSGRPDNPVGILEGLETQAGAVSIEQADGVWITQPDAKGRIAPYGPIHPVSLADNQKRIEQAVEVAKRADIILLALGDNEQVTRETVSSSAPGDRNTLDLYGDQNRLVEAMIETGKPIVTVLLNGRPLAINRLADKANAILEGWYLGDQGGNAVADIVFGKVNPGGKLPVSIPRSVGEIPAYYDRHPTAERNPYVEGKRTPLYPFGFGLSYTSFNVSAPRLLKSTINPTDAFSVEVDVVNTGEREGDEVVQIYVSDLISSLPRPILELKAFRRVTLKAGEKQTVRFNLGMDALAFWDIDMRWVVEPGEFKISAGNSSTTLQHTILTVV
jgi:beta-glucosidase